MENISSLTIVIFAAIIIALCIPSIKQKLKKQEKKKEVIIDSEAIDRLQKWNKEFQKEYTIKKVQSLYYLGITLEEETFDEKEVVKRILKIHHASIEKIINNIKYNRDAWKVYNRKVKEIQKEEVMSKKESNYFLEYRLHRNNINSKYSFSIYYPKDKKQECKIVEYDIDEIMKLMEEV